MKHVTLPHLFPHFLWLVVLTISSIFCPAAWPAERAELSALERQAYNHNLPAIRELQKLADAGDVQAAEALALAACVLGPTPQFNALVRQYAEVAATQGGWKGQRALGLAYRSGLGYPKDESTAKKWLASSFPAMKDQANKVTPSPRIF